MDWHPQVNRQYAMQDGHKPEDFRFEQWPVSNVRIEPSQIQRHAPFWYVCDIHPDTPLDNQYDAEGNKHPDPVGMCLQSVELELYDANTHAVLDDADSLPHEGRIQSRPRRRSDLWKVLTPGRTLKVNLVAFPDFYYLGEDGGMKGHYSNMSDGQFKGDRVASGVYILSMDYDGNVTVTGE